MKTKEKGFYKTFFHFCEMALIIRVLLINEHGDN